MQPEQPTLNQWSRGSEHSLDFLRLASRSPHLQFLTNR